MPDLLIELLSEEIPAAMQPRAAADLKKLLTDGLVDAGLTYGSAGAFATPRRLALHVEGLTSESPDISEERKGPRTDAPEKALAGFLRATGLTKDQLQIRADKKGDIYFATIKRAGRPASAIVAEVLEKTIRNFPWPKSMRWGTGSLKWVRPLHSILCILSDDDGAHIVPLDIDGITAGDTTRGHRFMAPKQFKVAGFDDYAAKLKKANVVLDAAVRADQIWADASTLAFAQGLDLVEDKSLLSEVSGLVEWPIVLIGDIDAAFLDLPPEVLQTSMREHQKFFSLKNRKTGRIEKFITVANIDTADNGATILAGNQKVLAARLADAKFFWENDLRVAKAGMTDWLDALDNVTFHDKLGSQAERVKRIAALAREIAPLVGADADEAEAAAKVAKADLMSQMVTEFPELQGVMGRYYAKSAGLSDAVANAAQDHYAPLGPSDDVPTAPVSVAVALADKIDTLTGFWAIDEKPTGSKDPFALRRAALGVIRLVLGNNVSLLLLYALEKSVSGADLYSKLFGRAEGNSKKPINSPQLTKEVSKDLLAFIHDRLKVYLRDQNIRHDIIDACIAMPGNDDLNLLVKRARALAGALETDDGANLVQGFKRANNILSQAEEKDGVEYSYGADVKFAETDSERALFAALEAGEPKIEAALKVEDFTTAVSEMAALRPSIDAFFEDVKVNADSEVLRRNRLNLLSQVRKVCGQVADLTLIEG